VIYSIDLILPVLSTQQTKDWAPLTKIGKRYWRLGIFFWFLTQLEILMGWIFGLMFVAMVSGFVKKD